MPALESVAADAGPIRCGLQGQAPFFGSGTLTPTVANHRSRSLIEKQSTRANPHPKVLGFRKVLGMRNLMIVRVFFSLSSVRLGTFGFLDGSVGLR